MLAEASATGRLPFAAGQSTLSGNQLCHALHVQVVMEDPVIGSDGHTYSRAAITAWLDANGAISPLTSQPLTRSELIPNHRAAQYNRGNAAAANSRDFRVSSRGPSLCEDHVNRGTSQSHMCFAAGKARSTAITARWTAAASETFHTTCQSLCEMYSCYRKLPPLSAPSTKTSRTCCHDFSLLRAALSLLLASAAVPRCNRGSAVMSAAQQQRIKAGDY